MLLPAVVHSMQLESSMPPQQLNTAWLSVTFNLKEVSSMNQVMKIWNKHYVIIIPANCNNLAIHILKNRYQQRSVHQLLSGLFCFVQTSDGKIVAVHHASDEKNDAVDFKKSIASTLQANFKGTEQEEEDDPCTVWPHCPLPVHIWCVYYYDDPQSEYRMWIIQK